MLNITLTSFYKNFSQQIAIILFLAINTPTHGSSSNNILYI